METSDTLYKYRTWSDKNHQSCLKNNELFFASPSDINDPFDFKISLDYRLLDTDEKKEEYVDKLLNDIKRIMKKDIDFEDERGKLINRIKNDPDQMEREYQSSNAKAMDLKSGVIQTHTKAQEWSYEKEIRLSQIWPDRIPSIQDRLVHFPTDFITEIILGLNIPLTHQQEIVEISQRKGIPVFKVEKARQNFSILKAPL